MNKLPLIALVAALAAFLYGLVHLFNLRFEAGDVYPPYSSLRTDPLGTKGLYESLAKLVVVRRYYQPLARLGSGHETTLLFLGAELDDLNLPPADIRDLERFVASGARLVVALRPSYQVPPTNRLERLRDEKRRREGGASDEKNPSPSHRPGPADQSRPAQRRPIYEDWGIAFAYEELSKDGQKNDAAALAFGTETSAALPEPARPFTPSLSPAASGGEGVRRTGEGEVQGFNERNFGENSLPETLLCHSALYFVTSDPAWRTVYARTNHRAVVVERRWGNGAIVLAADSYPCSNEALRQDRQPAWLAWILGESRQVLFDERHLGVQETPGLAALARQYRLQGPFLALLVLAGLFFWKSTVSFLPAAEPAQARRLGESVLGKEAAAGLVNLLRRNIPTRDILDVCVAQWEESCRRDVPAARRERMKAVLEAERAKAPRRRNAVEEYRKVQEALRET